MKFIGSFSKREKNGPYRFAVGKILIRWNRLIAKVIMNDPVRLKQSWPR